MLKHSAFFAEQCSEFGVRNGFRASSVRSLTKKVGDVYAFFVLQLLLPYAVLRAEAMLLSDQLLARSQKTFIQREHHPQD